MFSGMWICTSTTKPCGNLKIRRPDFSTNQGFPRTFRNIPTLSLTVVSMKNAEEFGVLVSQFGYGIFYNV